MMWASAAGTSGATARPLSRSSRRRCRRGSPPLSAARLALLRNLQHPSPRPHLGLAVTKIFTSALGAYHRPDVAAGPSSTVRRSGSWLVALQREKRRPQPRGFAETIAASLAASLLLSAASSIRPWFDCPAAAACGPSRSLERWPSRASVAPPS